MITSVLGRRVLARLLRIQLLYELYRAIEEGLFESCFNDKKSFHTLRRYSSLDSARIPCRCTSSEYRALQGLVDRLRLEFVSFYGLLLPGVRSETQL